MDARFRAVAPWIAVPFAAYVALLAVFWFDAPAWDDYDAILHSIIVMRDAPSLREWLVLLTNQHNEHRIAFTRLVAWCMSAATGGVDFRLLVLVASFAWLGILVLLWAEFRGRAAPWMLGAAAALLLQLSYHEASLVSMSALSNVGAIAFALACVYFAPRGRWAAALACFVCGVLAAGCLASGLFALPVAAALSFAARRRGRAAFLAAVAVVLWAAYFTGYVRPAHHPSPFLALTHPVEALHLFLVVAGGILPGRVLPIPLALAVAAALGISVWRGLWKTSPTALAWVAFLVMSMLATTAARVGFGVVSSSRYAVASSCLVAIAFLIVASARAWRPRRAAAILGACIAASLAIDAAYWRPARDFSFGGHLLAKVVPATPEVLAAPYFGMLYPDPVRATRLLADSDTRGIWRAERVRLYPTRIQFTRPIPPLGPPAGHVDGVARTGSQLRISGWADVPATVEGRTFILDAPGPSPAARMRLVARPDVAIALHRTEHEFTGFELELDYANGQQAASAPCIFVGGGAHPTPLAGQADCR